MVTHYESPLPEVVVDPGICHALVNRYLKGVASGRVLAGVKQLQAIERWHADLDRFDMDWGQADRLVSFFSDFLRHTTGKYAGQAFALRPFQAFIVANLVGWRLPDGRRKVREALIDLGRGNGKSPFAAGLALYLTFFDDEPRATGYTAATKREQARLVFDECRRFVESGPLSACLKTLRSEIRGGDGCTLNPLSSDRNQDGLIPHLLILDEVHAWRAHYRDSYDKLLTGMGKRRQPLALSITTHGDDLSEIYLAQYEHARKVLEGLVDDPAFFAFVAEVDRDDDIFDLANLTKSNPMLAEPDSPVQIEYLDRMATQAKTDKLLENQYRRYHCNQLVRSTEHLFQPGEWELSDHWQDPQPEGVGYGAFDLGRTDDFAAVALLQPSGAGYALRAWAWTTEERSDALCSDEFKRLVDSPQLTICDGNQVDFASVRAKIAELAETNWIDKWGYDPSWATETAAMLENEAGIALEPIIQSGRNYNEAIIRLRQLVIAAAIYHGGEPLLAWQAKNLQVKIQPSGLRQPDRRGTNQKIDGIVSALMAMRLALQHNAIAPGWYYESNRLEFL